MIDSADSSLYNIITRKCNNLRFLGVRVALYVVKRSAYYEKVQQFTV